MTTPELDAAEEAAAAVAVLRRHFRRGVALRGKDVANFVSDADVEAEHAIAAALRRRFPGHEILGEEEHRGDAAAEHLWVVDPLDGTHNFAHRIPHVAVSIAYCRGGRPECGVIVNPISGEWHVAVRGGGAFYNGEPARVADATRLDEVILGVGFPYDRGALMEATLDTMGGLIRREIRGIRRIGSAALDLCYVGLGRFGAYYEYQLSPWDFAAGLLFVEEAGGRVTTARGEPLTLTKTSVLASNGPLHEAMLSVLAPRHP